MIPSNRPSQSPSRRSDRDITVLMTLDPTFSYAARRVLSDGCYGGQDPT